MAGKSKKRMNPYIAELHHELQQKQPEKWKTMPNATEAAREIGISPMTYYRYAYDDISCEYMEVIIKIAHGLGVSADEFMRRYIKSKSSAELLNNPLGTVKINEQVGKSSSRLFTPDEQDSTSNDLAA